MSAGDVLRVGVVGAGHLGYHHARLYAAMPGLMLAGVADPDAARREKIQADFDSPVFDSPEALLEQGIDAVSVVTPTPTHCEVTIKLLRAGVHVLVEKPIAMSTADAQAMIDAAKAAGRILQVGHIERFNGAVMALVDAIRAPRFIECHRLSPYPMRGTDVSVVHDLMIHDLDVVLTLDRSGIESVDGVGVAVFSETEDIANVRLRFASGCVANVTSSRVSVEKMRKIRIFADNAYISTDYGAQEVVMYSKKPGPVPPGANPMEHIEIQPLPVEKDEPLKLELAAFVKSAREGLPPVVSGEDGLAALRLAERIVASIRK